ncbi:MAG: metal ABC transporter permease [Thermoproteota archaeon]|nr:metal ABC transporter permease [Thermoproteota archaeon]
MFEIFQYEFIQRAIISGIAISVSCSLLGLFLILKRFSLFGDAMAHVAFGGVSLGLFLKSNPVWVSFIVSILGGLAIVKLSSSKRVYSDSSIAVLLSFGLGMGLVLIGLSGGFSIDINSYLFGSILLVNYEETIISISFSLVIVTFIILFYRRLVYLVFNEEQAKVSGLNITFLNYLFIVLTTISIVNSIRLIGILMVSSLLVISNVASLLLSYGFKKTMIISVVYSVLSVTMGIVLSYEIDVPPSGMIVIILTAIFFITSVSKYFYNRLTQKESDRDNDDNKQNDIGITKTANDPV